MHGDPNQPIKGCPMMHGDRSVCSLQRRSSLMHGDPSFPGRLTSAIIKTGRRAQRPRTINPRMFDCPYNEPLRSWLGGKTSQSPAERMFDCQDHERLCVVLKRELENQAARDNLTRTSQAAAIGRHEVQARCDVTVLLRCCLNNQSSRAVVSRQSKGLSLMRSPIAIPLSYAIKGRVLSLQWTMHGHGDRSRS